MKKYFLSLCLFLSVSLLCAQPQAKATNDSLHVLFIGNSYTYFHELPQMVQQIASSQGKAVQVHMEAPGGMELRRHLQNTALLQLIEKGGWDYVVLQEQSQNPSMEPDSVAVITFPAARTLCEKVYAHNPGAKVIFYMTWGHRDGNKRDGERFPECDTYVGMQNRLIDSYRQMARDNHALCAPVGEAWKQIRKKKPDYVLYVEDGSHSSVLGTYLAANVIYNVIFPGRYSTALTFDLPSDQASYIQKVAQKTVRAERQPK